jgi:peptidoglycan/LPS O-acetylase OafA/YrhL
MRGIAALAVVFYHITTHFQFPDSAFYRGLVKLLSFNGNGGFFGVKFFFVLSGFLITYLMLKERKDTGTFGVLKFYMRRLLRIWPLYFVTIIIGFVVYPFLAGVLNKPYAEAAQWTYYVSFLTNFNSIFHGFALGILGVQWSVAIEEQFYLVWPLFFGFIRNKKIFISIILALLTVSFIFVINNNSRPEYIYFHTLSAINELALGGFAAFIAFYLPVHLINFFNRMHWSVLAIIYFSGFALIFFDNSLTNILFWYGFIKKPLIALFFIFIITEQTYSNLSLFKLRNFKFLAYSGKISYGIYLLHMVAIQMVLSINAYFGMPFIFNLLLSIILTIILSALSYRYFEQYFLNWKRKYN